MMNKYLHTLLILVFLSQPFMPSTHYLCPEDSVRFYYSAEKTPLPDGWFLSDQRLKILRYEKGGVVKVHGMGVEFSSGRVSKITAFVFEGKICPLPR